MPGEGDGAGGVNDTMVARDWQLNTNEEAGPDYAGVGLGYAQSHASVGLHGDGDEAGTRNGDSSPRRL